MELRKKVKFVSATKKERKKNVWVKLLSVFSPTPPLKTAVIYNNDLFSEFVT